MNGKIKGPKIGIIPATENFANTSPFSIRDNSNTFFSENVDNADVISIEKDQLIMNKNFFNTKIKEFNEKRTKVHQNRGKLIIFMNNYLFFLCGVV